MRRRRWVYWMYDRPDLGICRIYRIPGGSRPNYRHWWNEEGTRVIKVERLDPVRRDSCLECDPETGLPVGEWRTVPSAWTRETLREAKAKGYLVPLGV